MYVRMYVYMNEVVNKIAAVMLYTFSEINGHPSGISYSNQYSFQSLV